MNTCLRCNTSPNKDCTKVRVIGHCKFLLNNCRLIVRNNWNYPKKKQRFLVVLMVESSVFPTNSSVV